MHDDSTSTTSLAEVSSLLVDFYTNLFGNARCCDPVDPAVLAGGPILMEADATRFTRSFTDVKIREALFGIGNQKAPRPNGFTSGFFKANWDIVGADVIASVREFFTTGVLLGASNHTVIALIPKKENEPFVSDFRPIGLPNVVYKVITKLMASRMASLLPALVDESQGVVLTPMGFGLRYGAG